MKTIPAPLASFLASVNAWWACGLYTIVTPASGTLRWTDAPLPVVYGGNTFAADVIVRATKARSTTRLEVDQVELVVNPGGLALGGYAFPRACALGLLDGSAVTVERLIGAYPYDVSKGTLPVFKGKVLEPAEPDTAEVRITVSSPVGLLGALQLPRRRFSVLCPFQFGDALCGKAVGSDARTTAAGCTTTQIQATADFTNATANGLLTVGGVTRTIKSVAGVLATLAEPLLVAPGPGLAITATEGCDQSPQLCNGKGNLARFGGFSELPSKDLWPSGPFGPGAVRPAPPRAPPTPPDPPPPPPGYGRGYGNDGGPSAGPGGEGRG